MSDVSAAEEAFLRAERGDASAVEAALAGLPATPAGGAWRTALRALRASLDPAFRETPTEAEIAALADAGPAAREAADRACARMALAAALSFDAGALARWRQVRGRPGVADGQHWAWRLSALIAGDPLPDEGASTGEQVAAAALAAIEPPAADPDPTALAQAREACRRVAGEPAELEYLAHLALARLRRLTGRPHFALHILTALGRSAPPAWRPWIAWEMLLAGGDQEAQALLGSDDAATPPARRLARAGIRLVVAAAAGDRVAFEDAFADLRDARPPWRAIPAESDALTAMLDPRRACDDPQVEAWRHGHRTAAPFGLHGIGLPPAGPLESERGYAYVFAAPDAPARRLLRGGLGLVASARDLEGPDEAGKGGFRTETGLAVLALAGPAGLSREDFVRAVYGFKYVPLRHQGVLDVLVHRMRARLGDEATLDRSAEHQLTLQVRQPLVVPDGRSTVAIGERVLRALATLGWTGAQDASDALGIPRRSVHRALQELVAEGACKVAREGGKLLYRVHDTTFTVMTMPGAR